MRPALILLSIALLLPACGADRDRNADPLAPAPSGPVRFEDYFDTVVLLDADTRQPGLYDAAKGFRFSRKARLALAISARRDVTVRAVAESLTTGLHVRAVTAALAPGESDVVIGQLPADRYRLDLFVLGARVTSIPLASE